MTLGRPRWPLVLLVVVWAAYLMVRAAEGGGFVERALKGLLMPALLAWVVTRPDARPSRWLVLGLVFATIGDIAIDVDFVAGMLGFLAMQLCYIVGFIGLGALTQLRRTWPVAVAYASVWVGANLALGPSLGALRIPVLVYSLALCSMAALGTGVSAQVGIGAALFLLSDSLIAIDRAGVEVPLATALVMPTYLAGQWCIAAGWMTRARVPVSAAP
jgi:uncharacterized membrane protein YhhN